MLGDCKGREQTSASGLCDMTTACVAGSQRRLTFCCSKISWKALESVLDPSWSHNLMRVGLRVDVENSPRSSCVQSVGQTLLGRDPEKESNTSVMLWHSKRTNVIICG